ncbi:MAG: hypothetical protein ABI425_04390 [Patescibacteria group bacterium]
MDKKIGRPLLTQEQKAQRKADLLQRIEPYLKTGLSINIALRMTNIANSEFYKYMNEDEFFREKIQLFRQYVSVLVNNSLVRELHIIVEKQIGNVRKGMQPQQLSKDELDFLFKFALKSNLTKEEWGNRDQVQLYDPEVEIQKVKAIIEASTTDKIESINYN